MEIINKYITAEDIKHYDAEEFQGMTVAVHLHLFYEDLLTKFCFYLNNIHVKYDLYISTPDIANIEEEKIKDLLERTKITFKNLSDKQHVYLDGEDVSDLIRKPNVNELVSPVSAIKIIRIKMVELQRKLGEEGNVIMEGRDITTVVFPNADYKFYLDADIETRAKRRYKENQEKGIECSYEEMLEYVQENYNSMIEVAQAIYDILDKTYYTIQKTFYKV